MGSFVSFSRRCILVFGALLFIYLLASCSTLPRPRGGNTSLLVIVAELPAKSAGPVSDRVVIDGPRRLQFNLHGRSPGVFLFRVPPGSYRVVSRSIRWRGGVRGVVRSFHGATVDVPSAAIVLPEWVFAAPQRGAAPARNGVVGARPVDRRRAASYLRDFVRIPEWVGRQVVGFSPYSPFTNHVAREYTVRIESSPPDAQISVDGQARGSTPLAVQLVPGSHLVQLARQGYKPHASFINVGANGVERFTLDPARGLPAAGANGKISVMIESFRNLGASGYDDLAAVLTSSLGVAFKHQGIDIVASQTAGAQPPAGTAVGAGGPSFAEAEKAGARAFVSGDYTANEKSILIHAALYDTQAGLVKASVLFEGAGGIKIFDSIDRMSAQLSSAVKKALPEVGQTVVKERVITPKPLLFDTQVHTANVIRHRNERRYSLSFGPEMAGVMDTLADPHSPGSTTQRIDGPALGFDLGLDLPLSDALSFHLATMPILYKDRASTMRVEIPLYFGPRYNFYGPTSDIYMGLQGAVHFAPTTTVDFNSGTSQVPVTVGPFWLFGLNLETGIKIYTNNRLSQLPTYYGFGLRLGILGYRFNLVLGNPARYPMELGIGAFIGTRL